MFFCNTNVIFRASVFRRGVARCAPAEPRRRRLFFNYRFEMITDYHLATYIHKRPGQGIRDPRYGRRINGTHTLMIPHTHTTISIGRFRAFSE